MKKHLIQGVNIFGIIILIVLIGFLIANDRSHSFAYQCEGDGPTAVFISSIFGPAIEVAIFACVIFVLNFFYIKGNK